MVNIIRPQKPDSLAAAGKVLSIGSAIAAPSPLTIGNAVLQNAPQSKQISAIDRKTTSLTKFDNLDPKIPDLIREVELEMPNYPDYIRSEYGPILAEVALKTSDLIKLGKLPLPSHLQQKQTLG